MTFPIRRLRMFAGPNGSGKSTLVRSLAKEFASTGHIHLGAWINADEIEVKLRTGQYDFRPFWGTSDPSLILREIAASVRVGVNHPFNTAARVVGSEIRCDPATVDSYVAATLADILRSKSLTTGQSLTFETVMSHPSKIEFLRLARAANYRVYLYFVATETVTINLSRIQNRVQLGEHAVPAAKVMERYTRSLQLLPEALKLSDRAFLFDNSGGDPLWFAEQSPTGEIQFRVHPDDVPRWFQKSMESQS